MFTKGVVACMLGGALISATFPDNPLATDAHACAASAKKPEKALPERKSATGAELLRRGHRQAARARSADTLASARLGTFAVTAYTHYRSARGGKRKTATGALPREGRTVAVDPRVIPLGSRIHIEGVGERIAEDTGGRIKGRKLDLFLPSVKDCRRFGVRRHEVHIIAD